VYENQHIVKEIFKLKVNCRVAKMLSIYNLILSIPVKKRKASFTMKRATIYPGMQL
jgi:hypothetical protein